jgi:putative FmdB family regulatory protein
MPIYAYRCKKCGHDFDLRQAFGATAPDKCPCEGCDGVVVKVFTPPAIVFRGSGFHVNDYGRGNKDKSKSSAPTSRPTTETVSSSSKED